jgi:hypothetical protein
MSHRPSPQQQLGAYLRGGICWVWEAKDREVSQCSHPPGELCEPYILRRRHKVLQIGHRVDKQDALKIVSPQ